MSKVTLNPHDAAIALVELIRSANATLRISPSRATRSTLHDPLYRSYIIGQTLEICGKHTGSTISLNSTKLRFFQFLAVHPPLIPPFKGWLRAQERSAAISIHEWEQFPAGYASDTTYDAVVSYLTATGCLKPEKTQVIWIRREGDYLSEILEAASTNKLFSPEQQAIADIRRLRVPLRILQPS